MEPKLFFSKADFNELADLKGQTIEFHLPTEAEADYEFGLRSQQMTQKTEIKTILNNQRESVPIQDGQVLSGNLSAQFVDPRIPDPLPKNAWFIYGGIKYKAEEQPSITIKGEKIVRTVSLFRDPASVSSYR